MILLAPPEAVHAGAGLNGSERNERFQLAGHWHSEGGAGEGSQNQPRGRGEGSEGRRCLSRDSLPIQRIAFSGRVQATDGMVDGTVEAVEIGEGLMR